ncbi:MAG TPA: 2-C-methyl-D-erythritol 4-phosphate cytidylyltransferase, partial [Chloroflexota bacterium]|nr:2-C-methyl-D-erythritol 4-phosphate cytidylyltransferase [Chloroflexota bacterium]
MSALTGAIVVGAGAGRRFGGVEKAFFPLAGRPLLCYSVEVFEDTPEVDQICLVLAATSLERGAALVRQYGWRKVAAIVPGGRERQDSVRAGLEALPQCEWILVHDAARPLLSTAMVQAGLRAAAVHGAAVAAIPVRDTLKRVEPPPPASGAALAPAGAPGQTHTGQTDGVVRDTIDRSGLWAAQTPQVFRAGLLRAAFEAAGERAAAYTDDASLVEATGHPVGIYPGAAENVKLTLPEDVTIVEALLARRSPSTSSECPVPSSELAVNSELGTS